jgi:hypothetical protein
MIEGLCTHISCVLPLALLSTLSLCTQIITGEITRTVTDRSGAWVAGASASALCLDTKRNCTAGFGSAGEYGLA